ncbi:MAG TPA: MauE/DoxX family redox-associated membrane protein [Flavobacterium sp.]|nr:MauE/DoxX family redox-associated membrane protein [Flavobacterium sp.]
MKSKLASVIVQIIALAFILLFVYAAVSKLTDYQNFQLQVSQSPLLTAFADIVAPGILILEFGIAIMLSIPKLRLRGLFAAFALMVIFSAYIIIILNYSTNIPCSCGGILEKMGWTEHLIFNLAFVLLGAVAVLLSVDRKEHGNFFAPFWLTVSAVSAIISICMLYMLSDDIIQHHNNFIRRIPHVTVTKSATVDLGYKSYYFAGEYDGQIYLGNRSAPAIVTVLDTSLRKKTVYRIILEDTAVQFRDVKLRVTPPMFWLMDGTVPAIYSGNTSDWIAKLRMKGVQHFVDAEPVDSNTVAFRALTKAYGNLLGTFDLNGTPKAIFNHSLLQKQIDGIFDTDGMLLYSKERSRSLYLYYYRNQYTITDSKLKLLYRGNTIDTTSKAKIKTAWLVRKKQRKMAAPPLTVNIQSAIHRNLLFINSALPGRFDPLVMWEQASIIDVYDFTNKAYLMSFYVYKEDDKAMDSFIVTDTHLFAIFGSRIVAHRLSVNLKSKYQE